MPAITQADKILPWLNLSLLLAYPIAWAAPLFTTGVFGVFEGDHISILLIVRTLWENDKALSVLVGLFAIVAPILKTALLAGVHWRLLTARAQPLIHSLSKLAMADIFLIAISIVIIKGQGIGYIETRWGLGLFAACVLLSLAISMWPKGKSKR